MCAHSGHNLVPMDKHGLSDPYCNIYENCRQVKKLGNRIGDKKLASKVCFSPLKGLCHRDVPHIFFFFQNCGKLRYEGKANHNYL